MKDDRTGRRGVASRKCGTTCPFSVDAGCTACDGMTGVSLNGRRGMRINLRVPGRPRASSALDRNETDLLKAPRGCCLANAEALAQFGDPVALESGREFPVAPAEVCDTGEAVRLTGRHQPDP